VNDQVKQAISEINSLTTRIADLNNKIVSAEITGQNANDVRDQRDQAVNNLAERIDISVLTGANGSLSVFVGRGQVVVENNVSRNLLAVESLDNGGLVNVQYDTGSTRSTDITSSVSGGRIGGLRRYRIGQAGRWSDPRPHLLPRELRDPLLNRGPSQRLQVLVTLPVQRT